MATAPASVPPARKSKIGDDDPVSLSGQTLTDAQELGADAVSLVEDHDTGPRRRGSREGEEVGKGDLAHTELGAYVRG
jgi:hypothetical protein